MTFHRVLLSLSALAMFLLGAVPTALSDTGLPVPRFASIRSNEVNLRAGPGTQYPVQWVLLRQALPVEIIAEFEHWRRIRDVEGSTGWVHQSMLSGRRTVLITGDTRVLRGEPTSWAEPAARLEPGVIATVQSCESDWCRVEAGGVRGWIRRSEVWGLYPNEKID